MMQISLTCARHQAEEAALNFPLNTLELQISLEGLFKLFNILKITF
jgi:hypothetical protein